MCKEDILWPIGWLLNLGAILLYGFMQFAPAIYDFVFDATSLNELKGFFALTVMLGLCYSHAVLGKVSKLRAFSISEKKDDDALRAKLIECFKYGVTPVLILLTMVTGVRLSLPFIVLDEVHSLFDVSVLMLMTQVLILLCAILFHLNRQRP